MSAKKRQKKTLVEQILDKADVTYDSLSLNALTETLPTDVSTSDIFKTLALTGDKTGPLIGLVSLDDTLSEKKLARLSGNKKVQMIPQKSLEKTTGYIHGANNPIGIRQKHAFKIYIDQSALQKPTIIVSAGEVGRSIRINPKVLADFVAAEFAAIRE